jgi:tetratricopeptide (TPR) repeat protein
MTEYRSRPQDKILVREYMKGLEDIMAVADKASNENNLVSSGSIYYLLRKNYPYFKDLANKLSFNRTSLDTKLSHCRKSLSAQGFQEYRRGNLSKAIAAWENLLIIDPDNAEIKGAVKTAKLQQKNLKERTNGR